ncbi:MAG: molybdopterin-dependent oxidoreductase, partial [Chloroflexi bacterium]|nr:molybdopterin-dependent oxidoreductase [Chloroflexota bacterium]
MADRASTTPSQAPSWWSPALAGLLAMLALIGLQEALNAINQVFVSAPSAAAQTIVRLTPGPVINTMIESMGKNAIQLLTVSAYVGTALAGGVLGWGAGALRRRGAGWPAVAALLAGGSWLLYALVAPAQARAGGIVVAIGVGAVLAAVFAGLTLLLWQGLQPAAFVGDATAPDPRRRVLLGGGLATVALLHGGGWAARATMQGQTDAPQALTPLEPAAAATPAAPNVAATTVPLPTTPATAAATTAPVPTTAPATAPPAAAPTTAAPTATTAPPTSAPAAAPPTATAAPKPEDQEARDFAAIKGLSPEVTPIGKFYVVDEAIDDPRIDPKTWTLTIKGHVEKSVTLTFDELRALPFVDQYATLLCISYELGQDLISTAKWRGVRLSEVLRLAGVKAGATEVVLRSVDDYDESHAFERAMEPTTMLAYGMNDVLLPRQHGAPLRAIVPGAYGFKHVKWITEVEV